MDNKRPQIVVPEIDMVLVSIKQKLPNKLAQLSTYDKRAALRILRDWGEGVKPLKKLWAEVNKELEKHE